MNTFNNQENKVTIYNMPDHRDLRRNSEGQHANNNTNNPNINMG